MRAHIYKHTHKYTHAYTHAFAYCQIGLYLWYNQPNIKWDVADMSLGNVLAPLPALFLIYDLFYSRFHWFLHWRSVYPFVHKHHHKQKAPDRGNLDAVNVHPFEFVGGEYLHLMAMYVYSSPALLNLSMHALCPMLFLLVGGVCAALNHTRFDVSLGPLYQVKYHDLHHRLPEVNMGQYTMFWDWLFGTFRPYTEPRPYKGPGTAAYAAKLAEAAKEKAS